MGADGAPTFEGTEKKLEFAVRAGSPSLRALPEAGWRGVVAAADGDVISVMREGAIDAYVLSESSLLVGDDFATLITCGRTRLVGALDAILDLVPADQLAYVFYERKNAYFPADQPTSFAQDAARLKARLGGGAWRFGRPHGHHVNIFYAGADLVPAPDDMTLEVLMYAPDPAVCDLFRPGADAPRTRSGLAPWLAGYQVDEHHFTPLGYSLNAVRGGHYITVHVTPEPGGRYVSFETNEPPHLRGHDAGAFVGGLAEIFRPAVLDVVGFHPAGLGPVAAPGYASLQQVEETLGGYRVSYQQLARPNAGIVVPTPLDS